MQIYNADMPDDSALFNDLCGDIPFGEDVTDELENGTTTDSVESGSISAEPDRIDGDDEPYGDPPQLNDYYYW